MVDDLLHQRALRALEIMYGGVRIRVYEPVTEYLIHSFSSPDAVYLANVAYVATIVKPTHHDLGESWPEMPWVFPAEIKLLAALALSVPEGHGSLSFAPFPTNHKLSVSATLRLNEPETLRCLNTEALSLSEKLVGPKLPYRLREAKCTSADQFALLASIDLSNSLLMRGLYCLLKSQHLMCYEQFGEEAFMNVQIAREAALELIRERVVANGSKTASYADAHAYIRCNFRLGEALADFFEDQHHRWVATRHPKSQHGTFWTPPLLVDDFFETYSALVSVYRHLLLHEQGRLTADLGD